MKRRDLQGPVPPRVQGLFGVVSTTVSGSSSKKEGPISKSPMESGKVGKK